MRVLHARASLAGALFSFAALASASVNCDNDAFVDLLPSSAGAVLQSVTPVAENGSFGPAPGTDPDFPTNATGLPALCAVKYKVTGVGGTHFTFGMFLPYQWNNRMIGVGNTGFGGGIDWFEMGPLTHYGFATISTDTGHLSTPNDASWAKKMPNAQANWGHLALHTSVVLGKQVIKGFYGSNATYAYFSACSGGGRQGLRDLQLYPEDFNGVIAGAAPWLLSHLHPWAVQVALPNLEAPKGRNVDANAFQIFNNEVIRQCDPQDGLTDKIVSNPYGCRFNWQRIQCEPSSPDNSSCLTGLQIQILNATYSDWVDEDRNNQLVYPAFTLASSAAGFAGHQGAPSSFGTEYVENFVLNDTDWDWHTLNISTVRLADSLNPGNANADMYDLSAFSRRGGKLLTYHGLADPLIPPASSIYYYEAVLGNMSDGSSQPNRNRALASTAALDDFYRLFLVPGMYHCSNSNGFAPWYFAGAGQKAPANTPHKYSVPGFSDRQHDVVLAIMAWVENGTAPEHLIATAWKNGDADQGPSIQRPLCPYPQRAVYQGSGDPNTPGSWSCTRKNFIGFPEIPIAAPGT